MGFIEESVQGGLTVREFTLGDGGTENGVVEIREVTGVLWQPPDPRPGAPLVCCGHGGGTDRHGVPIPWLASKLVGTHGFNLLAIDGPVHGRRQVGQGGRDELMAEWRREGNVEQMTADWKRSLNFAQAEIGEGPVGYWGLSMGTIYGIPFIADEPRISAAVLGLMGMSGPESYRPILAEAAARVEVPVLFLQQLEDELFSREEYAELFDALATTNKRLHANPGQHMDVPPEEVVFSVAFLVAALSSPGQYLPMQITLTV